MSFDRIRAVTMPATGAGTSTLNWPLFSRHSWHVARAANQLELTDGRQCWVRLLIFVVPGPTQDNRSRREGEACIVAAVNLTS